MVLDAVISQQLIPTLDGGVQPAFEVMFLNNAIRNMIRESKIHQIDGVIATSQGEGMISMDNSIISLYRKGAISRENAIAYSSNSEDVYKRQALMTAMLRSQDIPTKLVVGYTGNLYHAWINVYLDGQGWVDNVIYFDGHDWKLMDPTFASNGNQSEEIMKYIGNGSNYQGKYSY